MQVNLQLLFIADLKQKKIDEEEEGGGREKPGRQIVTFLIFCNLGLWITYNFEIQKVSQYEMEINTLWKAKKRGKDLWMTGVIVKFM